MAMINAIHHELPMTQVKGCNFHFSQAIWRKVQDLGLVELYKSDHETRRHVRMCAALSRIPVPAVEDGWCYIMESAPNSVEDFNDYFVEQWLENPNLPVEIWNCCGERHRTTNSLEGWHSKLNKRIPKNHPNYVELIQHLKADAEFYDLLRLKVSLNLSTSKRLNKYIVLDKAIEGTIQQLTSGRLNISSCLEKLS